MFQSCIMLKGISLYSIKVSVSKGFSEAPQCYNFLQFFVLKIDIAK